MNNSIIFNEADRKFIVSPQILEIIKNLNDLLSYWTSEKYQKYQDEEPAQFVVIDPKTGEEM